MGAGIDIGGTISGRFGALRESGLLLIGVSRKHGTAEGVQQCRVPCPVCCSHYVVGQQASMNQGWAGMCETFVWSHGFLFVRIEWSTNKNSQLCVNGSRNCPPSLNLLYTHLPLVVLEHSCGEMPAVREFPPPDPANSVCGRSV